MDLTGQVLAWATAAVCGLMLLRLVMGERRRAKLDRVLLSWGRSLRQRAHMVYRWRAARQARLNARVAANEAIEKARSKVNKQGNVYTPESFKGPKKPH